MKKENNINKQEECRENKKSIKIIRNQFIKKIIKRILEYFSGYKINNKNNQDKIRSLKSEERLKEVNIKVGKALNAHSLQKRI